MHVSMFPFMMQIHNMHFCMAALAAAHLLCHSYHDCAMIITADFNAPLPPYDGQVVLCPPQFVGTAYKRSTSFGVIGVRLHNKVMAVSQPVAANNKESKPLGGSEADAICRELGYTGVIPGSIATKSAYEHLRPPYNFNHCLYVIRINKILIGVPAQK